MEEAMSIHVRLACKLLVMAACTTAVYATTVHAVDNARYVSITGSNTNACTLAAPCRSLQRGIQATPPGGELRILDTGAYGQNAIVNKSMTISGNGNTVFLAKPIIINQADAVVALRGLVLNGQGAILLGVDISAAATVHIERCVTHSFAGRGISATNAGIKLFVLDSISRDNAGDGLFMGGEFAGSSRLTIDNSRFENNGSNGVAVQSGNAAIHRSIVSGNGGNGIRIGQVSTGGIATVESSVARGNGGAGLQVNSGAIARISNSTFTANAIGVENFGTTQTRQNNSVTGNTTEFSGTALVPIGSV
jgi:hypothetical protein